MAVCARQKSSQRRYVKTETCRYLEAAGWLAAAALAIWSQILPEERVVEVATAVEVDQRRLGGGLGHIAAGLCLGYCLESGIEAVDVGLVVLGVVQLHDLAGDVGFERAIVVWTASWSAGGSAEKTEKTHRKDLAAWPCFVQSWFRRSRPTGWLGFGGPLAGQEPFGGESKTWRFLGESDRCQQWRPKSIERVKE